MIIIWLSMVQDMYDLGQYACHSFMASAQFFSFSRKFELRREDSCAQVHHTMD
jgi:hypothetical protein